MLTHYCIGLSLYNILPVNKLLAAAESLSYKAALHYGKKFILSMENRQFLLHYAQKEFTSLRE